MTKQRVFERKLIADALRSVLLAQYLQSQTSTWEILLLAGKKALEGRIREGLYNKMSLVDICKISIQQIHVSSKASLPIGHPAETVRREGGAFKWMEDQVFQIWSQVLPPAHSSQGAGHSRFIANVGVELDHPGGPLQLWCFLIHCQDFYTKIFSLPPSWTDTNKPFKIKLNHTVLLWNHTRSQSSFFRLL